MAETFSRKHRAFINHYCQYFNATDAAKHAGYSATTRECLAVQGSRLLRDAKIRDEVNRICSEQDEAALASKAFVVEKIKAVLNADLVKYVNLGSEGATQADLEAMPLEIRRMVTQIERVDHYIRDYDGKQTLGHSRYKFKLIDKTKMVELLAKHTGAVKEGPLIENNNINQMGYGQLLDQAEEAEKNGG